MKRLFAVFVALVDLVAGLLLPAALSDNPAALVLWLPLLGAFVAMGLAAARALEPESA